MYLSSCAVKTVFLFFYGSPMRLTDFTIAEVLRRCQRHCTRLLIAFSDQSSYSAYISLQQIKQNHRNLRRVVRRLLHFQCIQLNLNIYGERQYRRDFRISFTEIIRVAGIIGYERKCTSRFRYRTNKILAACIVKRRLATSCRWHEFN